MTTQSTAKRIIFVHMSGGTYEKIATRERVAPNTMATVRRNVPIVTDATRAHERAENCDWSPLAEWLREGPGFRAMVRNRVSEVHRYGVETERQAVY